MATAIDYYQVLGVSKDADQKQIKTAYHSAAKRVHPDAGGTQVEMERVNEAYRVLSSPLLRRDYDASRPSPHVNVHKHPSKTRKDQGPRHAPDPPHHSVRDQEIKLNRWARGRGFSLVQKSFIVAVPAVIIGRFLIESTVSQTAGYFFSSLAFVPVYGLILGFVWILDPAVRISLERLRLGRHYSHWSDFVILVGLVLAIIPILLLWFVAYGS
jgi:hypothetical protein